MIPSRRLSVLFAIFLALSSVEAFSQTAANYIFSTSTGTLSVIQSTPGAVSPALSGGNLDDGWYNSIPIGFNFVYEGVTYSTLSASTNGWARFGGPIANSFNVNNLNTGPNRPLVAPLWDDLELPANGLTYKTTGISPNRICTIEWLNAQWNYVASTPSISFQVKLYESNRRIEFIYRQEAGVLNAPSASIGIAGASSGQYISLNSTGPAPMPANGFETNTLNAKPANGQLYRFDHYVIVPVVMSVSPVAGMLNSLITISGSGFDAVPSLNIVYCGAVKANVVSSTTTQIIASVPVGTNYRNITVTSAAFNRTAQSDESFDVMYNCGGFVNFSSFAPLVNFTSSGMNRTIGIQDLDLDGKSDVASGTLNSGGSVTVNRNISTAGTFNASSLSPGVNFRVAPGPIDIEFADVDGDGKKEIITANAGTADSISILRNTSAPGIINTSSFANRVNFPVPDAPSVDLCDLDGDGRPEIVATSRTNDQLLIRQNLSVVGVINTSSFGANVVFTTGDHPYDVKCGDIDGDGKKDIVTCNYFANTISVFLNTSTPGTISTATLAVKVDFATAGHGMDLEIADIDGDGKNDVVVVNQSAVPESFSVLRNTSTIGSISFAPSVDIGTTYSPSCSDISDIDGNGKPDVVVGLQNSTSLTGTFRNTSTPGVIAFSSGAFFNHSNSPFDVCAGDLDGDSKPEILAAHLTAGTFTVLHNTTSSLSAIAPATVTNATTFCDNGTWKTYHNPLDNTKVLFAVKDNGNNLGSITVDEYRDATPGNYNGQRFLQRHFRITPTSQPVTSVQIRFYFSNAELSNLMAVDPSVTGIGSLSITKYNGPTEDGIYNPSDATSLLWFPQGVITTGTAYGGSYLELTTNSFSEFWIHGGVGVLPIELTSFEAIPIDRHVELRWETATEINNDYFTIEKTQDGSTIHSIDTIQGAGNSSATQEYVTTDAEPFEGTSYYRLKQVDYNGAFTYSEWREVSLAIPTSVTTYPNPSTGKVSLLLPGDYDAIWHITVANPDGQIVFERNGPKWDLGTLEMSLQNGNYIMHLSSENTDYCQKIVILN